MQEPRTVRADESTDPPGIKWARLRKNTMFPALTPRPLPGGTVAHIARLAYDPASTTSGSILPNQTGRVYGSDLDHA
jgi:hypothetical protein